MRLGLLASAFDPFHPGHLWAMQQALEAGACDGIVAAVQVDPTVERPGKRKPVLPPADRVMMLESIRYVKQVVFYGTERDLWMLIWRLNPACLIVGEDHQTDRVTGADLAPVFWAKRKPEWSGTRIARQIAESVPDVAASLRFTQGLDPDLLGSTAQDIFAMHGFFRAVFDAFDKWKAEHAKPPSESVPGPRNPEADPGVQGQGMQGVR